MDYQFKALLMKGNDWELLVCGGFPTPEKAEKGFWKIARKNVFIKDGYEVKSLEIGPAEY